MSWATSSWLRIVGRRRVFFRIGSLGDAPGFCQSLDVEESQGRQMFRKGAR